MTEDQRNPAKKTRGAPFQKGNPGKPKGARRKVTVLAERLMVQDAETVVQAVIDAAKAGDMTAARLVLERIAPPRKGSPVSFSLPRIESASDVLSALGAVVQAVADGDLTPDEAVAVASLLESERRAIETIDIESRLAALEKRE